MIVTLSALVLASLDTSLVRITVDAAKVLHPVSPSLYGIFFEEINQAGDGGIYSELLRGRGLEDASKEKLPTGWRPLGKANDGRVTVDDEEPLNAAHPFSLRVDRTGDGPFGVVNEGYWGISVKAGHTYPITLWLRTTAPIEVRLEGKNGKTLAAAKAAFVDKSWQRIRFDLKPSQTDPHAQLVISPTVKSTVWLAYASMMPGKTWKNRPNGLRTDLATAVDAMRPAFVRFPGGCYVEGGDKISDGFDWRRSIGPLEARKGLTHSMWGYTSTFGLGFHEYLQWCEDLKAEPLFVVNCGMSHREITPLPEMDRWVEHALSAIEYANGPVTSKWGAERAKNGHPKPFNLKYIEIGNENGATWSHGGPAPYAERYQILFNAIKAKHPELLTIADNPVPHPVEILDEHYYSSPAWFWGNANRYDTYNRKGPAIYVGEYAVTQGCGTGNLAAALGEAAFMTGMERNSDIVRMSSYAPLFVNVNNRQWNPNALVFDSSRAYGTPSYHVQAMFANHRADQIVHQTVHSPKPTARPIEGVVGLQTWRTEADFKDLEVEVDGKSIPVDVTKFKSVAGKWTTDSGLIRQSDNGTERVALFPEVSLEGAKKYSYHLKARKQSGAEGFIVVLDAKEGGMLTWNLGGWNNTETAFQRNGEVISNRLPSKIESDRWYDIKIEREGNRARGFLDGKLIQEVEEKPVPDTAVVTGIDVKRREVVMKIVNGSAEVRPSNIQINGVELVGTARTLTLAGTELMGENSFDRPHAIAPRAGTLKGLKQSFTVSLPAYSVTVLRLPVKRLPRIPLTLSTK